MTSEPTQAPDVVRERLEKLTECYGRIGEDQRAADLRALLRECDDLRVEVERLKGGSSQDAVVASQDGPGVAGEEAPANIPADFPINTTGKLLDVLARCPRNVPLHSVYFVDINGKSVPKAKSLSISRERVRDGRLHDGDESVPYSFVVWANARPAPPPPSETASDLERDGRRWRALMNCPRIRMWGSAGVDPKTGERTGGTYVHFGAEFWSDMGPDYDPTTDSQNSREWGLRALTAMADALAERAPATPTLSDGAQRQDEEARPTYCRRGEEWGLCSSPDLLQEAERVLEPFVNHQTRLEPKNWADLVELYNRVGRAREAGK